MESGTVDATRKVYKRGERITDRRIDGGIAGKG